MILHIEKQKNLENLNTLHLPAVAPFFGVLEDVDQVSEYLEFINKKNLNLVVIGSGSNLVLGNLENTFILKNEIKGIKIISQNENLTKISVGAGEDWDDFVKWSCEKGLSGVEALSWIPGTVGASPVQNIGAYGQEVKETIFEVSVFDKEDSQIKKINNLECGFSYRNSVFKENPERYIILSVVFGLRKNVAVDVPEYKAVQEFFDLHEIENPTILDIRNAVINIRKSKLPDWTKIYNAGSFFGNPRVSRGVADGLKKRFPEMPQFETGNGEIKIPAGWLIEESGLKGFEKGNFKTYEKHALVLVHKGGGDFNELEDFRDHIVSVVKDKFGVELKQEPVTI